MSGDEVLILVALVLPLLAAAVSAVLPNAPDVRDMVSVIAGLALATVCAALAARTGDLAPPQLILAEPLPGLRIAFRLEPLGAVFAVTASILWVANTLFSIGYMSGGAQVRAPRLYACFALAMFGVVGIALAANLFTLFVFYEALTLSTYTLVTHKGDNKARAAGSIYVASLLGASVALLLPAIIAVYVFTGSTDFAVGGLLAGKVSPAVASVLLALFVFGAAKAALPPLHVWLPSAMVAPTPVSAILHAVAVVKAGVFVILKVGLYTFGFRLLSQTPMHQWLLWLAAAAIVWAGYRALRSDHLKARLAWSTIGQLAAVTSAALLATPEAWWAGGVHMVTHAFGKITLFMCAGAIQVATGAEKVSEMRGLGRRMPWLWVGFLIASLSVIGLPPTGGFWSKFLLVRASFDAGQWPTAFAMLASSLLAVAYLLPPVALALMPAEGAAPSRPFRRPGGAPQLALWPIAFTASGVVALFVISNWIYAYLQLATGGAR
jgi:multicomponent Na+:H+ antiporter subunit D